jgi:hypothetical protein
MSEVQRKLDSTEARRNEVVSVPKTVDRHFKKRGTIKT